MLKVSETVKDLVLKSELALSALQDGYLNLSAYASKIKPTVEKITKKSVTNGSIVIALSRLGVEVKKQAAANQALVPKIILDNIVVKSDLVEFAFEKTAANIKLVEMLYKEKAINVENLFMISQGIGEIILITTREYMKILEKSFKQAKPKIVIDKLVAISVTFNKKLLETPNVIFALVRALALKKINIIEIVSTRSELAFVVRQVDLEKTFIILNDIYQQN